MTPELAQYRAVAIALLDGLKVSPERRAAVLRAAGKNEQHLALTMARLLARRTASEGLSQLLGQHEDAQAHLADIAAKGTNVTGDERILYERFKLAAANMEPSYEAGKEFLRESADVAMREAAAFAAGRHDAIRRLRESVRSTGRIGLAEELATIEERLAGEAQAKRALIFEWQNCELF